MAVAFVAQCITFGSAATGTAHVAALSSPTTITVGNHLILMVGVPDDAITVTSITDPRGNTWQTDASLATVNNINETYGILLSCKVANAYQAGDSLTINLSATDQCAAVAGEFSGLHATTWYAGGNIGKTEGSGATFASGATAVAAAAGDLTFGGLAYQGTTGVTPTAEAGTPTAWTALTQANSASPTRRVIGHHRIVAGAESPNYDGATGGTSWNIAVVAVYRTAAGGGGPVLVRSYGSGVIG